MEKESRHLRLPVSHGQQLLEMETFRHRMNGLRQSAKQKTSTKGWILPKQESSWAPPGTWTNIDLDITPTDRQIWTSWTILGYWMSDVISVQSWQTGSSILAVGLTWFVL